jgi:hypothetical protein
MLRTSVRFRPYAALCFHSSATSPIAEERTRAAARVDGDGLTSSLDMIDRAYALVSAGTRKHMACNSVKLLAGEEQSRRWSGACSCGVWDGHVRGRSIR